jgi:nitrite reductase/ring-hydroxylating ferredoxin subunit
VKTLAPAGSSTDLPPGEMRLVQLPCGRPVAVYNVDGEFYATDDTCSHGNSSLTDEGMLLEHKIICGWHGGAFDVRTGEAVDLPCMDAIRTYKVVDREGAIFLEMENVL